MWGLVVSGSLTNASGQYSLSQNAVQTLLPAMGSRSICSIACHALVSSAAFRTLLDNGGVERMCV